MRTAIDTNVLSALWGGETPAIRVSEFLDEAAAEGGLVISPIVYIELCSHPNLPEDFVKRFLETMQIEVEWALSREIWQLAAERFAQYAQRRRRQGPGQPKRFPADFLVASHALLRTDRLVTLEQRTYGTDFPELTLAEL